MRIAILLAGAALLAWCALCLILVEGELRTPETSAARNARSRARRTEVGRSQALRIATSPYFGASALVLVVVAAGVWGLARELLGFDELLVPALLVGSLAGARYWMNAVEFRAAVSMAAEVHDHLHQARNDLRDAKAALEWAEGAPRRAEVAVERATEKARQEEEQRARDAEWERARIEGRIIRHP